MKDWCERNLTPPGVSFGKECAGVCAGAVLAALYSLRFFLSYFSARAALYETDSLTREAMLREDAVLPAFSRILGTSLRGFSVLAFLLLFVAAYHYAYHFRGSRSILLMRRLPRRFELHRRCLAVPALGLLLCLAAALLLLGLYFLVYRFATPAGCLPDFS